MHQYKFILSHNIVYRVLVLLWYNSNKNFISPSGFIILWETIKVSPRIRFDIQNKNKCGVLQLLIRKCTSIVKWTWKHCEENWKYQQEDIFWRKMKFLFFPDRQRFILITIIYSGSNTTMVQRSSRKKGTSYTNGPA